MSKKDKTEIVMIVDRSGSMSSMRKEAQGGINRFLEEQKDAPGKAVLTIAQFDDQYDVVAEGVDVSKIDPENMYELQPRGCTALLDAVGRTINTVRERQSTEKHPASNTLCLVITDGQENASQEFKKEEIKTIVKNAEDGGWDFVFLGANIDAFAEGFSLGFINNTQYTLGGVGTTWAYMSSVTTQYRNASPTMRSQTLASSVVKDVKDLD